MSLAAASPAFADLWYENYQKGEDALKAKRWDEAVSQFTQAIGKKGDPGVGVKTYGMNFVNYFPYLKLGIAYFELGQTDAALQAFETEERLGAIARSASDIGSLRAYREKAQQAQQVARAAEKERIAKAVADAIEEARGLEQRGQLSEALAALGRAIAVDPQNAEALAGTERIRGLVAAREREQEQEGRLAGLVREARELIAAGRYEDASAKLSQAVSIRRTPEVTTLLDQSQAQLRTQLEATRSAEARGNLVRDGVGEAARLEREGQFAAALRRLQEVLAVEPQNREALLARDRLAKAQAEAEAKSATGGTVTQLLSEAGAQIAGGAYDKALAALNRALALDPQNAQAIGLVSRVYSEINRSVLGRGTTADLPPAIVVNNQTNAVDEAGVGFERISRPVFVLTGMILGQKFPVRVDISSDARASADSTEGAPLFHDTWDKTMSLGGTLSARPFQTPVRVPSGLTVLKITVADSAGLSSTTSYRVRLVRPLWLSTWFYVVLAVTAAGVAGSGAAYRVHRRNLLLRRRFNPYIAGRPVLQDDMFLGREALLAHILETIHNNSILLYGERRIGKTSVQHHLRKRLVQVQDAEFEFHPVFIDLQGTPEDRFFHTLGVEVFEQLSPLLDGAKPGAGLAPGEPYTSHAFVRDVHEVLKILRARSTKKAKLVLLVDEVDALNDYDPRVNQKLRSLFMKTFAENLVAVASGVSIKKRWESEGSPWYNFFHEIEVKPFTEKDARDLIERPIRGIFQLEDGVVEKIVARATCRPYLIQKLCVALVNRAHDEKRRRITLADVEAVGDEAGS